LSYFKEAIKQDPRFALAYVGLSDSYLSLQNYTESDQEQSISKAEVAINRALIINPLLDEAHASLAGIKFSHGQLLEAETSYKKTIELAPNYTNSYFEYGGLLNHQGRYEDAYQMNKKAIVLDPLSITANYDLAWIMFELGLFSEAEQQLQHAFELMPDGPTKYLQQNWSKGVDLKYFLSEFN